MIINKNRQVYSKLNNGVEMPLLGLGVYAMSASETKKAVEEAINTGYRLIDTAAMYGNEREVGEAIRANGIDRKEIFVTTKVNNPDQGYDPTLRAFDQSLQKLNIDYIDLYLVHWPIKHKRQDTWRALEKLYSEKRVRAIGVANYLLPFLHELESYSSIAPAVNQVEFSPYLYLRDELDYCKQHSIQLQAYTPLMKGSKFGEKPLAELASKYGKTPAQIVLRWNIEHEVSAIPKSATPARIKENFDIFDFSFEQGDLNLLDSLNENYRLVGNPLHHL